MARSTQREAIEATIQAILGDAPKSSLLFGAPAISMRQIEASVEPSAGLSAVDVLPAAVQVSLRIFGNAKQVQLKKLVRSGKEVEWIVFRPSLNGGPSATSTELFKPDDKTGLNRAAGGGTGPAESASDTQSEIVRQIELEPVSSKPKLSTKRSFFRPFMRSEPSDDALPSVAAVATIAEPEMNITLPPAHRIGAGDFGDLWMPTAAPAAADLPTPVQEEPTPPASEVAGDHRPTPPTMNLPSIPSRKQSPVPSKRIVKEPRLSHKAPLAPQRPAQVTAKSRPHVPSTEQSDLARPPLQTMIQPVNIKLRPKPPAVVAQSTSRFPNIEQADGRLPVQNFHPVNIDLHPSSSSRLTSDPIASAEEQDSSLPYLREKPRLGLARTEGPVSQSSKRKSLTIITPTANTPTKLVAQPGEKDPSLRVRSGDSSEPIGQSDQDIKAPQFEVTISSTSSPTPTLSSPLYSPMTPLSSIISSPTSATLPDYLDHSRKSDPDGLPAPWLSVAFQDLPFGPEVPAFQILGWAQARWQILCAELVVIMGAVYIIQVLGI